MFSRDLLSCAHRLLQLNVVTRSGHVRACNTPDNNLKINIRKYTSVYMKTDWERV